MNKDLKIIFVSENKHVVPKKETKFKIILPEDIVESLITELCTRYGYSTIEQEITVAPVELIVKQDWR